MKCLVIMISVLLNGCIAILDPLHDQTYIGLPGFQPEATSQIAASKEYLNDLELAEPITTLETRDTDVGHAQLSSQDCPTQQ